MKDPMTPGRLTAEEAARRLGVKRQTLYAYVSRGVLGREKAADGRASLFDAAEIDALRESRGGREARPNAAMPMVCTALTLVHEDGLFVRGESLARLADAVGYEHVASFLWGGAFPLQAPESEGGSERGRIAQLRESGIPGPLVVTSPWVSPEDVLSRACKIQRALPSEVFGIDRLRASVLVVSAADPLRHDVSEEAVKKAARTVIAVMVDALPDRGYPLRNVSAHSLAFRLWPKLSLEVHEPEKTAVLGRAMSLLVDHGLATSCLGARVAASVRADPYSVISAGLGVVGGVLHGASSANVHRLYRDAEAGDVAAVVGEHRRRLGHHPGFGHRVYERYDPRFASLMGALRRAWSGDPRLRVIDEVLATIAVRTRLFANIDAALGALTYLAGMEPRAGETIFAIARSAGWIAHALEEYAEEPLRFRGQARYIGA